MSRCFASLALLALAGSTLAEEPVRMQERLAVGSQYRVQARVQLTGTLTLPAEKGKAAPKTLTLTGESAIDYDERVLSLEKDGKVGKTVRFYRRVDFERQVGDVPQKTDVRPAVRRMVVLRHEHKEVPFSPDGPLTWAEIDAVRTDVFAPALAGLLPSAAVRVGDRWKATAEAVRELTDLEQIDEGSLDCRLERISTVENRRQARVSLSGTIKGVGEDGPSRQVLEGEFTFDLDGQFLSGLTVRGKHSLVSPDGKEGGRVEGRFVMSRSLNPNCPEISEASLRGLALEPGAENSRLLYENPELGVSFLHARRWRVSGVQGRQVTLDSSDGSGVLITLDPLDKVPTGGKFLEESRDWLIKQKGKVVRVTAPQLVQRLPQELERFALDVEMGGQPLVMEYYVARQRDGGATLAARLVPRDVATLQKEVDTIARSLRISRPAR